MGVTGVFMSSFESLGWDAAGEGSNLSMEYRWAAGHSGLRDHEDKQSQPQVYCQGRL